MEACKTARLSQKELKRIAGQLTNVDLNIMEETVIAEVQKEEHISYFVERKSLWCYLINESNKQNFRYLLQDGLDKFCLIYGNHCVKGADRHLRMIYEWNMFCSSYAVASLASCSSTQRWHELTKGYEKRICEETRSSVMSSILTGMYTFLVRQVKFVLESLECSCQTLLSHNDTSIPTIPDDDIALYRYFGFSLHASIISRKPKRWSTHRDYRRRNSVLRKSIRFSALVRQKKNIQLRILEHLLETDKSAIPAILKSMDRGRMTFPHRKMLSLCRSCSVRIKKTLNFSAFQKDGRKISRVSLYNVLLQYNYNNLLNDFRNIGDKKFNR